MVSVLCVCLVLMGCMFLEQQYKMHLLKSSSAIRKKLKKTNKQKILSKLMFIIIIHVFSHYESIIDIKTTVTTTIPKNNLKKKRWPPLTPQSESQLK